MTNTGYIYKLCCNDVSVTDVYVGSTKNHYRRKNNHKTSCNNSNDSRHNLYVYRFIRENGGWDNWSFIILDTVQYKEKHELHRKEREYIESLHATLNKQLPTRTQHEWRQENKEEISEKAKQYYQVNRERELEKAKQYREANRGMIREYKKQYQQANKQQIAERKKKYHKDNREAILEQKKQYYQVNRQTIAEKAKQYHQDNKEKISEYQKQYHQDNKERLKEYQKQFRQANRERIIAHMNQKITCECGAISTRTNLKRHQRTKKHHETFSRKIYDFIWS